MVHANLVKRAERVCYTWAFFFIFFLDGPCPLCTKHCVSARAQQIVGGREKPVRRNRTAVLERSAPTGFRRCPAVLSHGGNVPPTQISCPCFFLFRITAPVFTVMQRYDEKYSKRSAEPACTHSSHNVCFNGDARLAGARESVIVRFLFLSFLFCLRLLLFAGGFHNVLICNPKR